VLCAYTSISLRDTRTMASAELSTIQARNDALRDLVIRARRGETGFIVDDPLAETKRQKLLSIVDDPANAAVFSQDGRWSAIALRTGFSDFIRRLATGDLYSETRKEYVFTVIADRWGVTFWLNLLSIVIAWAVAVPLGIRSARREGTLEDRGTTNVLFLLWSLPAFFVGTLFLHHLCTASGGAKPWFPNAGLSSDGSEWLSTPAYLLDLAWHGFLPLLTLSYASFVSLSRYLRGNLLEQINADYVRTARAKGADDDRLVYRHAFRNSSLTLITLTSGLLASLFGGVLIVELIFSIPGLGSLLLDAAKQQDAPLIMGSTVISVGLLLVGILVADLLYAVVDPRIRGRFA
jgi:peptide/nickel transport system permease protein